MLSEFKELPHNNFITT